MGSEGGVVVVAVGRMEVKWRHCWLGGGGAEIGEGSWAIACLVLAGTRRRPELARLGLMTTLSASLALTCPLATSFSFTDKKSSLMRLREFFETTHVPS